MWTTVYVATGYDWALEVKRLLEVEGFIVKVKHLAMDDKEETYEILGPEFESEDIQLALSELRIM